jgi:hypothetical protein
MAETGVAKDELGDVASELKARDVVDPRVLPGEDATQARLGGDVGIAAEGPDHPGHCGRADPDPVAVAVEGRENIRASRADRAVGSGYDGSAAVTASGVQSGSPIVAGLPSVSARRMAVTGRHSWKWYFASYIAMALSANVRFRAANRAAVCSRFVRWAWTAPSAIAFQVFQIGGAQNLPIKVSSSVRVLLLSRPRLFTSFRAVA